MYLCSNWPNVAELHSRIMVNDSAMEVFVQYLKHKTRVTLVFKFLEDLQHVRVIKGGDPPQHADLT